MKKLSMVELNRMTVEEFKASAKIPLTVVLDNVRSQNNIGSVFRTADAFGIEHISLCGICSTPPHREIHKTALGAEESVDWSYHEESTDCVRQLKDRGYKVYAVEQVDDSIKLDAFVRQLEESASEADSNAVPVPMAIIFGNEVEGVQDSLLPLCDGSIEIPQYGTKHSLNVSCAAAIVMWEVGRELRIANGELHQLFIHDQ